MKKIYKNINDRSNYGIFCGVIGIIINLFLGLIKLFLGIYSRSITIMSDAFNNVTDMTSSILTIIGFKLSSKKENQYRPYIYTKYENLSSILLSMIMFILGIIFLIKSINKIISPEQLIINYITYIILFISLIVKIFQYIFLTKSSKKINSKTLYTNSLETRNDIITNTSILISMFIMKLYNINIDGYLGIIVSLFIIYTSINNCKNEIYNLLINDKSKKINQIKSKILSYDYIEGIHNLIIHTYGYNNDYMTLHAEVNNNIDFNEIYNTINKIENDIKKQYSINLTIHIDTISN